MKSVILRRRRGHWCIAVNCHTAKNNSNNNRVNFFMVPKSKKSLGAMLELLVFSAFYTAVCSLFAKKLFIYP